MTDFDDHFHDVNLDVELPDWDEAQVELMREQLEKLTSSATWEAVRKFYLDVSGNIQASVNSKIHDGISLGQLNRDLGKIAVLNRLFMEPEIGLKGQLDRLQTRLRENRGKRLQERVVPGPVSREFK